uniref:Cysteine-rich receptor-like protein kinase 25 n=2 Tax=Aegilops tauschii subsp. strangulata TaxID=200361 RepID=A0A453DKC1_AEGTS
MALQRPPLLILCFYLLAALHTTSDAALSSHLPQAIDCSTSRNYTSTSAYAANLNQFLAALPENAVSRNGGFFNGTVGKGTDTVYGLAMCSADYSRSDCGDCLAATANSNANGLSNLCPGSITVLAWFDPCLVRYSDTNFFGTAEIGQIYKFQGASVSGDMSYSDAVVKSLKEATANAVTSLQRFAATSTDPYTLVQCTWDLPPDQCKQCLDVLSANATESDWWTMKIEGKRKSHNCALRYSNTSFVVVPFGGPPMPQSVDQAARSATQSSGIGIGSLTIGVVGSVVGLIMLACLAALIWKVLKLRSQCRRGSCDPFGHIREFTYRELASATREFADGRKLGQGAFGVVYKGAVMLQDEEVEVAIKKNLNVVSDESRAAFKNEVDIMKPLNHLNIIRLVGWCDNRSSLLLVYELVEDRNLEDRLYGGGASVSSGSGLVLDWRQR